MVKRKTAYNLISLMMVMILFISMPIFSQASAAGYVGERKTVKVGFFEYENYNKMDLYGLCSGYGFDQINYVANYLDYDFEFVGYDIPFYKQVEMLERGEIDLLSFVHYSEEKSDQFLYSKNDIGKGGLVVTAYKYNPDIVSGQYDTYDGKTVGTLKGSVDNEYFEKFAQKNNFEYNIVEFDTIEQAAAALHSGEIDMLLSESIRSMTDEKVLDTYYEAPFYLVTSPVNKTLMNNIDRAMAKLDEAEPNWRNELAMNYYGSKQGGYTITIDENKYLQYLAANDIVLKVLACPDRYPYSYIEAGEVKGALPKLFERMANELNIKYTYLLPLTRTEYKEAISEKKADIILDYIGSQRTASYEGYKITENYMQVGITEIRRKDYFSKPAILALVSDNDYANDSIEKRYKYSHIVYYSSLNKCLEALDKEQADATILFDYTAQRLLSSDDSYKYEISFLSDMYVDFSIAVLAEDGHYLRSIINKKLNMMKANGDFFNIIESETQEVPVEHSLQYIIMSNSIISGGIALAIILILGLTVVNLYARFKNRGLKRALEYQKDIERLHKGEQEYAAIIQSLSGIYFAMYSIDLENKTFKEIEANDTMHLSLGTGGDAQAALEIAANYLVRPEYKDEMLIFNDISTMAERIGRKHSISYEFNGKGMGWTRGTIVVAERNLNGVVTKVLYVFKQINDEKNKEMHLEDIGNTDSLTDYGNRRAFYKDIATAETDPEYVGKSVGIVFADLNGLKVVNDTQGHDAGDQLIVKATEGLTNAFPTAKKYRLGGDEFVLLCFNIPEELFNRKLDKIDEYLSEGVSLAIGRRWLEKVENLEENVAIADKDMYKNKNDYYQKRFNDRRRKPAPTVCDDLLGDGEGI